MNPTRKSIRMVLAATLILMLSSWVSGQEPKSTDFLQTAARYNFSKLWTLTRFEVNNDTTTVQRSQPLGFIGDNYQRFYIHFISVKRDPFDRYRYHVEGKTRVRENIFRFRGAITIISAEVQEGSEVPDITRGFVGGQYRFYEDSAQTGSGVLKGTFRTDFYIDEAGRLKYDGLDFDADGFSNNQFKGTWTNYKTLETKTCNWGDYRIPEASGFDSGTGEFIPSEKFETSGWMSYRAANGLSKTMDSVEAKRLEKEPWWIRE